MDNSQITKKKRNPLAISFIEWSLPPFLASCPFFFITLESNRIYFFFLILIKLYSNSNRIIELMRQFENGIYLFHDLFAFLWIIGFRHYFGNLQSFQKNGSNIPFFLNFSERIIQINRGLIPPNTLWIEIVLVIPTIFFLPCSNLILSIFLSKIYLRSCSNLLIFTNLRYLPLKNE